jgi:hypothetical protein
MINYKSLFYQMISRFFFLARFSLMNEGHANECVPNQRSFIMKIKIEDIRDIAKLLGTIRLAAKGDFEIAKDLLDEVLTRLAHVAKERGIAIRIVSPSGERIVEFTVSGTMAGAALGYYVGQLPGALIGAVAGGVAGYFVAHTTLVMDHSDGDDHVLIQIA